MPTMKLDWIEQPFQRIPLLKAAAAKYRVFLECSRHRMLEALKTE
jgi:hypothetical protein